MSREGDDIEFIPTDEIVETEPDGAEDGAVHLDDRGRPQELMTVEAEDFDADRLDEDEAEELEMEAEEAAEADEGGVEEDREEDLEEIIRRHYGVVEEVERADWEAERGLGGGDARPQTSTADEFVCQSCFLRKPTSQRSDPGHAICIDCADNDA